MAKNMFCSTQKASSKEYRDNFDLIFSKYADVRFIPGETGIVCEFCNHPILMEPFEWDFEFKRCYNCKTYVELKNHKRLL